jgi:hypothetical protein
MSLDPRLAARAGEPHAERAFAEQSSARDPDKGKMLFGHGVDID